MAEEKETQAELNQMSLFENKEEAGSLKSKEYELAQAQTEELAVLPVQELNQLMLPKDVFKNRSALMDDVIKAEIIECIEQESTECLDKGLQNMATRYTISYEKYEGLEIKTTAKLTQFDREVIDAVATLATEMKIISSASIYRIITGRTKENDVSAGQKKKVVEAMKKCANCRITIDITEEFKKNFNIPEGEQLSLDEALITFAKINHKSANGVNEYYKIFAIPPLFRFAETFGKVSSIPLGLINTPVNKTDIVLAIQGFLLRSIEDAKQQSTTSFTIPWETIYKFAEVDQASSTQRTQKKRARENTARILTFWVENGYISGYDPSVITEGKKITHLKIEQIIDTVSE